jgi:hypothetical protein
MTVYGSCGDEEVSPMSAALVFLLCFALLVGWEVLCLGQVLTADRVRFLPRWVWAVACLIFIPLGGIPFLLLGRCAPTKIGSHLLPKSDMGGGADATTVTLRVADLLVHG